MQDDAEEEARRKAQDEHEKRYAKFKPAINEHIERLFQNRDALTTEMDMFVIENRSKSKITELITPLIYQIESDREERARMEVF
jgi:adenylate kinase